MQHLLQENIAINLVKVGRDIESNNYFLSRNITDKSIVSSLDNSSVFPLYLYPEANEQADMFATEEFVSKVVEMNF